MRRKKLRQQRPKAFIGALIGAGASLIGGLINAHNSSSAAKDQAAAILQASRENSQAMAQQNANNNKLQQQSIEFMRSENELNRELQRNQQMNLQLQGGMLDTEQRMRDSRIQVKRGGKVSRKKLRDAFFYGGGNIPFRVTDGGGVLPLGQTPEGFDLYEIVGNDHNHYHKTKGGKYKSGVGIEFDDSGYGVRTPQKKGGSSKHVVEGEGNQNSSQGEYLLATPDAGLFISKHSINGFNPVKAINQGMHPLLAYQLQEESKGNSPVEEVMMNGGITPRYRLRRGGRCKAWWGLSQTGDGTRIYGPRPDYTYPSMWNSTAPKVNGTPGPFPIIRYVSQTPTEEVDTQSTETTPEVGGSNNWWSGNLTGAAITSLGNIGGALLSNWGASRASRYLRNASLKAYNDQANAIAGMHGIDPSILKREDFRSATIMPVVHNTTRNYNNRLASVDRQANSIMQQANNNSLSSAARYNRLMGTNAAAQEMKSRIFDEEGNRELELQKSNADALNQAAIENARLAVQGNQNFMSQVLDLAKYNNDIENFKITEPVRLRGEGLLSAAQARATYKQLAGSNWGNTLASIGKSFGNAISTDYNMNRQLAIERSGGSLSAQVSNVAVYGSPREKAGYADYIRRILRNPNLTESQRNQYNTMLQSLM